MFSPLFEIILHAFFSYRHIYTSNGMTLHDIAISLAMGQRRTTGGSDDMCHVCGDGENLLLCNGCPLAFHAGGNFVFDLVLTVF